MEYIGQMKIDFISNWNAGIYGNYVTKFENRNGKLEGFHWPTLIATISKKKCSNQIASNESNGVQKKKKKRKK